MGASPRHLEFPPEGRGSQPGIRGPLGICHAGARPHCGLRPGISRRVPGTAAVLGSHFDDPYRQWGAFLAVEWGSLVIAVVGGWAEEERV